MKLLNLRNKAKLALRSVGVDERDADFVIAETLNVPITNLPLIDEITESEAKQIEKNIKKRKNKMPVSKIFKHANFFGLEFKIDNGVLSPRQDSEVLIETALKIIKQNNLNTVLDLCTGSGCLAVSIAKNASVQVSASDISAHAINIAKQNAKNNGVEIKFVKSNMFEKLRGKFNLIVSNPPYIESSTCARLDDEVKLFDPILALDGGADGLDFYRTIAANAKNFLTDNGFLILEIGYNQKNAVLNLFSEYKFLDCVLDYGGRDRVMVFKLH